MEKWRNNSVPWWKDTGVPHQMVVAQLSHRDFAAILKGRIIGLEKKFQFH